MLLPPLTGPIVRDFAYSPARPFVARAHRGVDFVGAGGAVVRAACRGRVAWAAGTVVSLRCGPWRVSLLPFATIAVRAGAQVRAGSRGGALGHTPGPRGLHLGVRRAGDPFAYVDPAPMLARRPRVGPPPAPLRPVLPRARVPAPPVSPRPHAVRVLAPWPAWLGLALLLVGAGGLRVRSRRVRVRVTASRPSARLSSRVGPPG